MVRATNAPTARKRHKRVIKAAKGYRGTRGTNYRNAKETVMRAMAYAYRDRKGGAETFYQ